MASLSATYRECRYLRRKGGWSPGERVDPLHHQTPLLLDGLEHRQIGVFRVTLACQEAMELRVHLGGSALQVRVHQLLVVSAYRFQVDRGHVALLQLGQEGDQ